MKWSALLLLVLVASVDMGSFAEARHLGHQKARAHHAKHVKGSHGLEEQPVITTIIAIVGIVAGTLTIADKAHQVATTGTCLGGRPREERSSDLEEDDQDLEETHFSCLNNKKLLAKSLSQLKAIGSGIDLSEPIVFEDGEFYAHGSSELGVALTSMKRKMKTPLIEVPTHKVTPLGRKSSLRAITDSFKSMPDSMVTKTASKTVEFEEEPVIVTIAAVVGLISGTITIVDRIADAVNKDKDHEEQPGSETLLADPVAFWGAVASQGAEFDPAKTKKVGLLMHTLITGLRGIQIEKLSYEEFDGTYQWVVPIAIHQ